MKVDKLNKWRSVREQGKNRYILVQWILKWGLLVGALTYLFRVILSDYSITIIGLLVSLLVFSFGGFLLGNVFWYFQEGKYQEYLEAKELKNND